MAADHEPRQIDRPFIQGNRIVKKTGLFDQCLARIPSAASLSSGRPGFIDVFTHCIFWIGAHGLIRPIRPDQYLGYDTARWRIGRDAGGSAINTTVQRTELLLGGTDELGVVSSGGTQIVSSDGFVSGNLAFGTELVMPGGVVSGNVVDGTVTSRSTTFGDEIISGGQSFDDVIGSNGHLIVGGLLSAVSSGVSHEVLTSGYAIDTTVSAGG